ncbi:MAG TPA: YfhO family protein [Candidatus Hydrogenedentes bacterium]|nr:YfhO family protein [Candidatus Hydrogenedentota bacterium]
MTWHKVTAAEICFQGLLLLVLLVILFPAVFLRGEMSLPGSILLQSPPWNQYYQGSPPKNWLTQETLLQGALWHRLTTEMLKDGEWPLWNPLQLGGMPLLANSQNAVLYPPRLIHLVTDPYVATTVYILLNLWLCGFTAYLLGRGIGLSAGPAQFLSVGWMLCAYNQYWAYWPPLEVSPWAPVVLLGAEWILAGRCRKGFFTLVLGSTLLLLAGHPETAFGQGFGVGVYFLLRLLVLCRNRVGVWRPVAVGGAAWSMALLVCAIALLPLLEYLPESEQFVSRPGKAVAVEFAPPLSYLSLWVPRFFGAPSDNNYWENPSANFVSTLYLGLAAWVGLGLLFTRQSCSASRVRTVCLAIAAAFCTAMAFPLPFMRWIQELPVLNSMWRFYYLPFGLLAALVLASAGIRQWFGKQRQMKELQRPALFLAAVFGVVLVTAYCQLDALFTNGVFAYVLIQIATAAGIALLCLLVLGLSTRRPFVRRAGPYVLVVILAADLLYAARDLRPTCPREQLFFDTALTEYLRALPQPSRVRASTAGIMPGLLQHYGIEQWNGYDGIMPYRSRAFFARTYESGAWWRIHPIIGIGCYLFPKDIEEHPEFYGHLERVGIIDDLLVMRDNRALPRAFLVGGLSPVESEDALFKRLADLNFDPLREVLTESPPPTPWPRNHPEAPGTATVRIHKPNRVVADTDATAPCVLVLSDTFFPGWTARVDGVRTPIFPAYFAFRGVTIPAGKHVVEFAYEPASFRIGLGISWAALFLGALAALRFLWNTRRAGSPSGV